MATDNTTNQNDATINASTIHEGDVEQAHLTQSGAPVQVQVPQGENVVRVQVTPGETVELPFPTDGLVARLGDNGNLAVKVGDITVILVGYADATGQADVTIVGNDGKSVDVAAVLASTDPNLDIQTAAGPGAGDQGTGPDNNGGLFSPFDPLAGIGGLNAVGGLDPTALNYNLIQREFIEIIEADEEDTSPDLIGISGIRVVNEDDFGHDQTAQPSEEVEASRAAFGINTKYDSFTEAQANVLDRLELPNGACATFGKHKDGNDPFDTQDHEEGSQTDAGQGDPNDGVGQNSDDNGGIDQDREPLSVTVVIEANFKGDFPGKVTFDQNGDGIDTGDTPIIDALEAKGLTSHGHELAYILVPADPVSGKGEMIVAYYMEDACNCYGGEQSIYEGGENGSKVPVIVFTLSIEDNEATAAELNGAGHSEIPLNFTIYGVIDHPEKGSGIGGEDILDINTPFFLRDGDGSVTVVPGTELIFKDVDDVPQLGCIKYDCWNDLPVKIVEANLTIGHDESSGVQHTKYDSAGINQDGTLEDPHNPNEDQRTDDVGNGHAWQIKNDVDDMLDGIVSGNQASGEDVDLSYQQGILAKLSSDYVNNGNFCGHAIGVAETQLTVSFGADGKAKGNDQAGETKFQHDNGDTGSTGTDGSQFNYDSDGNLLGNDGDATDKQAFELFMKQSNGEGGANLVDATATNWTVDYELPDGTVIQLTVRAYQLDANTIIGIADPVDVDGDGVPDEVSQPAARLEGGESNDGGSEGPCSTGMPVFVLHLDPKSGELQFVQYHQIHNTDASDSNDAISLLDSNGNPLVYFEATDFDGDTVEAALDVAVVDDAPRICGVDYDTPHKGIVDEDALPNGIEGGPGDIGVYGASVHGQVLVNGDTDQPLKFSFNEVDGTGVNVLGVALPPVFPLTDLAGNPVTLDVDNSGNPAVLKGVANNVDVFKIELNTETGDFTFTLLQPVKHPFDGNIFGSGSLEDTLVTLGFSVKVTDSDGDSDSTNIYFAINDDTPEVCPNPTVQLDDDALPKGNPGGIGDDADPVNATGTLGHNYGADGAGTTLLTGATWPNNQNSMGFSQVVSDGGKTITIKQNGVEVLKITLSDDNSGNYTVTQLAPINHKPGNDENNVEFTVKYQVKDADGDAVNGTMKINVDDDTPELNDKACPIKVTVEEDGMSLATLDKSEGNKGFGDNNGDDEAAGLAGSLTGFYKSGADVPLTISMSTVTSGLPALLSHGIPVTYSVLNGVLTASAGGNTVFTLKVNGDGSWSFDLQDQLDHVPGNGENHALQLNGGGSVYGIDFSSLIVATDNDGDKAPALNSGSFVIGVEDDVPCVIDVKYDTNIHGLNIGVVDEDALLGGIEGGPGDIGVFGASVHGKVNVAPGADEPVTFSFGENDGTPVYVAGAAFPPLFPLTDLAGNPVSLDVDNSGNPAILKGVANGVDVFTISLDTQTGDFTFTLLQPVKHPGHDDLNIFNGQETSWEDLLVTLGFNVKVTDADGDSDNAQIFFKINDDSPVVLSNPTVQLDDDALPNGNDGGNGDDANAVNVTGILAHNYGADGAGTTLLTGATLPNGFSSTVSDGGKTLIIKQNGVEVLKVTLTDATSGSYTVTQLAAIKHSNGNEENNIEFTVKYQVKDGDGDIVGGTMKINVDDDTPTVDSNCKVKLDDDALANGNPGGNGDNIDALHTTGTLSHSFGADGAGTVLLTSATLPGGMGFTQSLTDGGKTLTILQDGTPVLKITLTNSTDGSYTVTQLAPIHHADGNEENNVDFTVNYQVKDKDGDTADGTLEICVDDDTPVITGDQIQWTVDEDSRNFNNDGTNDDGLPGRIQGGPGDANGGNPDYIGFAGKSLGISYGADGPAVNPIAFATSLVAKDANGTPMALKSGGVDVVLSWDSNTNVLTATAGNGGPVVFTVTVHQNDGTIDFQLKGPIDHPFDNPNNTPGDTGGEYEDMVRLELGFTAKDADGDTVPGTVVINVNDDSPDACCCAAVVIAEPEGTHLVDAGSVTINAGNYASDLLVLTSATSPTGAASVLVNQNEGGVNAMGVTSPGGNGEARYNEINYVGNGSNTDSEALVFELQNGDGQPADNKYAVKASVDLNVFFAGEGGVGSEVGTYTLYKDGVLVAGPTAFIATTIGSNGAFHLDINWPTGFDKIEFKAAPGTVDNQGNAVGDSSDYNVKEIKLDLVEEVATPTEIKGKICAEFGADGPAADGGIALTVSDEGHTGVFHNGHEVINQVSVDGNTILGVADGVTIWKLEINDATKDYTFTLYEKIDGEVDPTIQFHTLVTDRDGDSDAGCIKVTIDQNDIPTLTVTYDQTVLANSGLVDEDHLPAGNQDQPSPSVGDDTGGTSCTGHYNADFKSDTDGTVAINVVEGSATGLTALDGSVVKWHAIDGEHAVGYVGNDPIDSGSWVFEVTLSGPNPSTLGDGTWEFELLQPVKHTAIDTEDNVSVSIPLVATDSNGDTAAAQINVSIDDDLPVAVDDGQTTISNFGQGVEVSNNAAAGLLANDNMGADGGKLTSVTYDNVEHTLVNGTVTFAVPHGSITVNEDGSWTFDQTSQQQSPLTLNFTYKVTDGDGDTDTANFSVKLQDAVNLEPINYNDAKSGDEPGSKQNNVMIILDRSGSMNDDADGNGPGSQTRLQLARAAIENLLNKYDQLGDVRVLIVQFGSDGQRMEAWATVAQALAYIDANDPNGDNTSYSDALAFGAAGLADQDGKIVGAPTTVYFLSDGVPTEDGTDGSNHSLSSAQQTAWNTALENNGVSKVYAVGIGTGLTPNDPDLQAVANPNGNNNNSPIGQVISVTNANDLSATLTDTVVGLPIAGNVLTGVDTSGVGDTGVVHVTPDANGDGSTYVYTFSHDGAGTTYDINVTWDGVSAAVVAVGGSNVSIAGHQVSFDTANGRMTFDFDTGAYSFVPNTVNANTNVVFHYGTKDSDGSTDQADAAGGAGDDDAVPGNSVPGGADLVITIKNTADVPVITSIVDNVVALTGNVDGGSTNDNMLEVKGTAEAGATVKVYDGANFLGQTTADGLGNWSYTTGALGDGTHQLNATSTVNGNTSGHTYNHTVTVDTVAPTLIINIVDTSLSDSDTSSVVHFNFSEAPVGFAVGDIVASNGSISNLQVDPNDPKHYTATFTATDGVAGTGSVTVAANLFTDAAGNNGGSGGDTVAVDRVNPTVTVDILDSSLSDGDTSSVVKFTFSEVPVNFGSGDISATNGSISNLQQDLGSDPSGKTWTATYTANDGVSANGTVTVGTNWQDNAGNAGVGGSDSVAIDRSNPTLAVNIVASSLNNGSPSSQVTFTFSEAPTGFVIGDIVASHGTVTNLQMVDATHYTATFTKDAGYNGSGSVSVAAGTYTDAAGNNGGAGSDTVSITSNVAPVGGVDHIYTNSDDDVTVLSAWLLANDTDADSNPLTVTGVHQNTNLFADLDDSGLPTSFQFNLSNSNTSDGSTANFDYDLSDGITSVNVAGQVHLDQSGSIDGGAGNDIVIGKGDDETLIGNGGADFLIGNGGHDTLVFDAADKLVDGGADFDRVQTASSTFAWDSVGSDAKFANVEMVDLGDSNHNGNRTVTINAADLLDNPTVTVDVDQSGGGTTNINVDLFVIGDNTGAGGGDQRDNVTLTGGFSQVLDLDNAAGNQSTFQYDDGTFGNHTYTLWTNGAGKYVAVEVGLDVNAS